MINLGVSLLDFKPNYSGGINSFSLGLIEPLEKKCKLLIYTNNKSYLFIKKKFPNSKIIVHSKINLIYLLIKFFAIMLSSEKLFIYSEDLYFNELKKRINRECDIFYCPLSYLKPLNLNLPTITSIHDLQHYHMPQNFNFVQLKYRRLMYKLTIEKSTKIQASSEFIKNDIKKIYPHIKKKIVIINEGISNDFRFKSLNFKKNNFIFFPAQLWHHKNHMTVLKALKHIYFKKNLNFKLIMVGSKFSAFSKIDHFMKKNKFLKIKYLGKVNFSKLLLLYKNCRFLISPAIYESSSIPILEACKTGRPIIASRSISNKEMGKKIKINFFETKNYKDLSRLILKIWSNEKLIKNHIIKNRKTIKKFSWEKISNEYLKVFLDLTKNKI